MRNLDLIDWKLWLLDPNNRLEIAIIIPLSAGRFFTWAIIGDLCYSHCDVAIEIHTIDQLHCSSYRWFINGIVASIVCGADWLTWVTLTLILYWCFDVIMNSQIIDHNVKAAVNKFEPVASVDSPEVIYRLQYMGLNPVVFCVKRVQLSGSRWYPFSLFCIPGMLFIVRHSRHQHNIGGNVLIYVLMEWW